VIPGSHPSAWHTAPVPSAPMHPLEVELLMDPKAPDIDVLLAELINRPAWHRKAACRGLGVDSFVIGQGAQYEKSARRLCAGCSVRQECLETAMAHGDTMTGLWGGTTPTERKQMRRGRAVA
jgi:hypothetical protein